MTNAIRVGEMELTPLVDGVWSTGPEYFGPTASFAGHEEMLGEDGLLHLPIGCFLARGGPLGERTVLVDAGLGDQFTDAQGPYTGGKLNDELLAAGITRDEVDTVICSHLHLDHCGWLVMSDGTPGFPNARIFVGAPDWQSFVEEESGFMVDHIREGSERLAPAVASRWSTATRRSNRVSRCSAHPGTRRATACSWSPTEPSAPSSSAMR